MRFDPYNRFLKIWKSIKTLTPKVRTHLGVWGFIPSHSPTLLGGWNVILKLPSWPTPLQALALVASLRLRLQHPKCGGSFPHTFLHSWEHEMWLLGSFVARTFASPYLGREPKARVATLSPTNRRGQCLHWHLKFISLMKLLSFRSLVIGCRLLRQDLASS